jgi:AraC-like DNA-binding protein
MNKLISPPSPQLKREHIFSVRLTSVERKAIKQLARQMNVSPSHLVRHFLMQAIEYYSTNNEGGNAN